MKKKLFYMFVPMFLSICGTSTAQLLIYDHEDNEYEYMKMADGRNWMIESMRAKTDRSGKALHHYWVDKVLDPEYGYALEDDAAFGVGYAYLREEVLGSPGNSNVRTYSARTQGICPNGWHVPEFVSSDPVNTTADLNALITAYGGDITWWSDDAHWDSWKNALRLIPNGRYFAKFIIDATTKEPESVLGSQLHLLTSGHNGTTHPTFMMNVSGGTDLWGGIEEGDPQTSAVYCRCVENIQSTVTFSNFSVFGIDLSFSEALQPNYGFSETVRVGGNNINISDICPRNFIIKEYGTGTIIPVDEVFKSTDYKEVQLSADLDESKIYELTIVDPKLRDSGVPYGGYTFNGGTKMYFPQAPAGINPLEGLNIKINTVGDVLVIEHYGKPLNAEIYDLRGVKVMSLNELQGRNDINISHLNKGVFIVQLADNAGFSASRKFRF